MPRFRCRYSPWLLLAVGMLTGGCGGATVGLTNLPPHINPDALRDTILASAAGATFDAANGQDTVVKDAFLGFIGSKVKGSVEPQTQAHVSAIAHRKVLARIRVDKDYRQLKKNVWTYWALVDTSSNATGKWASAWVSAGNPLVLRTMTADTHQVAHTNAKARWIRHSAGVPWATCDPNTCCCEGTKCSSYLFE